MNPTIRPTKVLDYYDGVLVFTAEGDDGQQYVGSIVDTTDGIDRYLVKATTPERVKDLEKGRVDLRSLLLRNPSDKWYLTFDGNAPDEPMELYPQSGSIEATDFLPSEDYFLGRRGNRDAAPSHRKMATHKRGLNRGRPRGRRFGRTPTSEPTPRLVGASSSDCLACHHCSVPATD